MREFFAYSHFTELYPRLPRTQLMCRICLGDKELFNWNKEIFEFCGTTYKDCYYNYTQLDESDSENYPDKLCEMCANELRNAHFLFERSLESFYVLQNCINSKILLTDYSDVQICNETQNIYQSVEFSGHQNSVDNETQMNNISYISDDIVEYAENKLNNFQEMLICNVEEIDHGQFESIQTFESSPEVFTEQQPTQKGSTEIKKPKSYKNSTENSNNTLSITSELDNNKEKLPKITNAENSKKVAIKKYQSTSETSEQNLIEECESTTNQPVKVRKKYIQICQFCSLEVDGLSQLIKHEATHSENRERTHTCTKCGLKLYNQSGLNEHMKIHEQNRQKNHKCDFCDKAFYNKGALNVHRRIHLGQMLKCQICSKEYFRQIDLDRHLPTHSISPLSRTVVQKRYAVQCQYCNKTVLTHKLKEHMAIHSNQPQVKCKICDKQFYCRSKCVSHLRRFHRKDKTEYGDFIHNFVDCKNRMSFLKITQEAHVQTILK